MLIFDAILSFGGFGRLYRFVKRWRARTLAGAPSRIREICDSVDRACSIYPKHALCLQRAAVATCLLRREGIDAEMVIGCRKLPFMGHAWVEVDGHVVNDAAAVKTLYAELDRC